MAMDKPTKIPIWVSEETFLNLLWIKEENNLKSLESAIVFLEVECILFGSLLLDAMQKLESLEG